MPMRASSTRAEGNLTRVPIHCAPAAAHSAAGGLMANLDAGVGEQGEGGARAQSSQASASQTRQTCARAAVLGDFCHALTSSLSHHIGCDG